MSDDLHAQAEWGLRVGLLYEGQPSEVNLDREQSWRGVGGE